MSSKKFFICLVIFSMSLHATFGSGYCFFMYLIKFFCNKHKMFFSSVKCFSIIIEKFRKFYTAFAFCFDIYLSGPPKTDDNVSSTKDMIDFLKSLLLPLRLFDIDRYPLMRLILKLPYPWRVALIFWVVLYMIWGDIVVVSLGA